MKLPHAKPRQEKPSKEDFLRGLVKRRQEEMQQLREERVGCLLRVFVSHSAKNAFLRFCDFLDEYES